MKGFNMLMTANRAEAQSITGKGRDLLALIAHAGDIGVTRGQLAASVGKKRLNKWDDALLAKLEADGFVTVKQRPNAKLAHILEYVYTATGKE
jgi:hypothetical protein